MYNHVSVLMNISFWKRLILDFLGLPFEATQRVWISRISSQRSTIISTVPSITTSMITFPNYYTSWHGLAKTTDEYDT